MKHALLPALGLLAACTERGPRALPPAKETAPPAMSTVHNDVDGLRRYVELTGVQACAWTVEALGTPGLGPTDTRLSAYVKLTPEGWQALERVAGAPRDGSVRLPRAAADALVPPGPVVPPPGADRVFTGPTYALGSLVRTPYGAGDATRWRDGLVFTLVSR